MSGIDNIQYPPMYESYKGAPYADSHCSRKTSSKNMGVYIAHCIDKMKLLWKGIRMYGISRPPSNRYFMFMVYYVGLFMISQDLVFV